MSATAAFLDRDGTIIEDAHYIRDPEAVVLLPKAIEGLRLMSQKGYLLYVISNQSGVGQGIISEDAFWKVHERVCELLQKAAIPIKEFLFCFHHPEDGCHCRKPRAGLVPRRFENQPIDLKSSVTVGDKECDLLLADEIGARGYLVLTGKGAATRDLLQQSGEDSRYRVCADLEEVAQELPVVS